MAQPPAEPEKVLDETFDVGRNIPADRIRSDERSAPAPIQEKVYDLEAEQDKVRGRLAQGLLLLLAVTALTILGLLGAHHIDGQAAGIVLSPVVALTGTALGFYFGGKGTRRGRV